MTFPHSEKIYLRKENNSNTTALFPTQDDLELSYK